MYMGHGQYLVCSSQSSIFEECIIVFQVLGLHMCISYIFHCILMAVCLLPRSGLLPLLRPSHWTALCTSGGRGACAATSVLQGSCGGTLAWAIYPGLMLVFFGIICGGPSHGRIQGGMSKLLKSTVFCILQHHCKMNNQQACDPIGAEPRSRDRWIINGVFIDGWMHTDIWTCLPSNAFKVGFTIYDLLG